MASSSRPVRPGSNTRIPDAKRRPLRAYNRNRVAEWRHLHAMRRPAPDRRPGDPAACRLVERRTGEAGTKPAATETQAISGVDARGGRNARMGADILHFGSHRRRARLLGRCRCGSCNRSNIVRRVPGSVDRQRPRQGVAQPPADLRSRRTTPARLVRVTVSGGSHGSGAIHDAVVHE